MHQDILNALLFPMLFSMSAGTYVYLRFQERRTQALLILTLFQLVGAVGYFGQPSLGTFVLLALHATVVFFLLVHHLQTPAVARELQR